jgi:hypothetical protein
VVLYHHTLAKEPKMHDRRPPLDYYGFSHETHELPAVLYLPAEELSITGHGISWTGVGTWEAPGSPEVTLTRLPQPVRAPWPYSVTIGELVKAYQPEHDEFALDLMLTLTAELNQLGEIDELYLDELQVAGLVSYERAHAAYHAYLGPLWASIENHLGDLNLDADTRISS